MRIHLKTSNNKELVSFNYQPKLVGVLHKWFGLNEMHGNPALYSFSWLMNAEVDKNGLNYPDGAKIFMSFHQEEHLRQVVKSIMKDPEMCFGMKVVDLTIAENPDFSNRTIFQCASPIFVRRFEGEKNTHYTFEDPESGTFLEKTLLHKMKIAGLPEDESLKIRFDTSVNGARTKIIDYRGIKNKVNLCPVIIEGKPETKLFAWNVGVGNSTGIGFGAIY
ncbi:MAG: CRISPR-associated endoribonuclease Cas6 [Tannerellaceae bacterium]|jgi:CRISPR-associated endoribonuclease Cas6|nr:CRISPR-associated endoribonuclease Cas6 [Tannerellaceae bacterium]